MLEFVTFHSDRPDSTHGAHPNVKVGSVSYTRMIDMLFRSARIFHPEALCTVLTDTGTSLKAISGHYKRANAKIDHAALMLSRSIAQLNYIEHSNFDQPIILIDSDILVNASLTSLFELNFDIAITWRISFKMPINGGLLIINNRRPAVVKKFFREFVDIYRKNYEESASWYGDQLALHECIGLHYKDMADRMITDINGCRVLFLSCETYNFSPHNQYQAICSALDDKAIVHFKGRRKRLMVAFFEAWLKPRGKLPPWGHLRTWLARKRLFKKIEIERNNSATPGKTL